MEDTTKRTRGQSTVDTRRYGGRERRESRTTDERKRRRTSKAQHGMLTWDKLRGGKDHRERKRTNITEAARRSGDDEDEGKRKETIEHL